MKRRQVVFLINLLQDVNIVRPLVFMAVRDLGLPVQILISGAFLRRDKSGSWRREIDEISQAAGSSVTVYDNEFEALRLLQGAGGVLVAASESDLSAHSTTHDVFRLAPPSYVRITLQHGFECVGFLQSRDHDLAHGRNVTFGADIACGWMDASRLSSLAPSQRGKLYVSGPPAVLQMPKLNGRRGPGKTGLICENLHSVRLNVAGDFKSDFMEIFGRYCAALAEEGRGVTLRPHPGGQYVLKNKVELPANVTLNNDPMYKVDLSQFAFGISAPSSVVIDMVLAGIPVAVWRDTTGVMDAGNYEGLAAISSLEDWLDFSREAVAHPERYIERQRLFLENQMMPTEPAEVHRRFATLFQEAVATACDTGDDARERVMFVANGIVPTLQLSFIKPLAPLVDTGEFVTDFITEEEMLEKFGKKASDHLIEKWLDKRLTSFKPTKLVFCRYSGRQTEFMTKWARHRNIPVIYHVDDDLLNIPIELGADKFKSHNHPKRLSAVRHLLDHSDLVYCSTARLKQRFRELGTETPIVAGKIYCSAEVMVPAENREVRKIGYMGFDHAHDLELVVPALVTFLRRHPEIEFELFGSIPKPEAFNEFGDRIVMVPPLRNYAEFLTEFAKRKWDIGICPLVSTNFNFVKANTKWVEYSAVGIAVVASRDTVYDECCADDCGILAGTEDEWVAALEELTAHPARRFEMVANAQKKLENEYSISLLREQILQVFADAEILAIEKERIFFVSTDFNPTLQLSFIKPLERLIGLEKIAFDLLTVQQLKERSAHGKPAIPHEQWILGRIEKFRPTKIVFCRYNGPYAPMLIEWARRNNVPTIFHIDDDLLNVPVDIGLEKREYHSAEPRIQSVRYLLNNTNLVYCSTSKLKLQMEKQGGKSPVVAGKIYCSGTVLSPAEMRPVRKIGYMASADHAHNLDIILPAIVEFLKRHQDVTFELFGSIPRPPSLKEFGERITSAPPIKNYAEFLLEFAKYRWDIGICPLSPIHFNLMKANTKWVEYTSVGAAVVASRNTVYDECCADGCGILAETPEEWLAALDRLANDPSERYAQVKRAQEKLTREYSVEKLRNQVLEMVEMSKSSGRQVSPSKTNDSRLVSA